MTSPITDEQIDRAYRVYGPAAAYVGKHDLDSEHRERMRAALQSALDRRVGDKDRRRVRDFQAWHKRRDEGLPVRNGQTVGGRRAADDFLWYRLPLAEPPIQVSEGMLDAGNEAWNAVNLRGRNPDRAEITDRVMTAIYRAMESKRLEEQKGEGAQEGTPCGAKVYFRASGSSHTGKVGVWDERSGQDRRKGGK